MMDLFCWGSDGRAEPIGLSIFYSRCQSKIVAYVLDDKTVSNRLFAIFQPYTPKMAKVRQQGTSRALSILSGNAIH
jgi:hypothetical protein